MPSVEWRRTRIDRYAALSRVAVENKPSVFVFVDASIRPGDALQVFDFDDEYSVGVLSSSVHQLWFRERATAMKKDPRYTPDTVVDSFPWPQNITPERAGAVAAAMKAILDYREELMQDGLSLNDIYATFADEGANRLRDVHESLNNAVISAYDFSADDDILQQLLALNLSIAAEEDAGITQPRGPGNIGLPGTRLTTSRIVSDLTLSVPA